MIEIYTEVFDEKSLLQRFAKSDHLMWNAPQFNDYSAPLFGTHGKTYSFCGDYVPGPFIPSLSTRALLLVFHSDEKDTAVGFQMKFQFQPKSRLFSNVEGAPIYIISCYLNSE